MSERTMEERAEAWVAAWRRWTDDVDARLNALERRARDLGLRVDAANEMYVSAGLATLPPLIDRIHALEQQRGGDADESGGRNSGPLRPDVAQGEAPQHYLEPLQGSTWKARCVRCGREGPDDGGWWKLVACRAGGVSPSPPEGLLPCPFCGGRAVAGSQHVECFDCGAATPPDGPAMSRRYWNRRATPPEQPTRDESEEE